MLEIVQLVPPGGFCKCQELKQLRKISFDFEHVYLLLYHRNMLRKRSWESFQDVESQLSKPDACRGILVSELLPRGCDGRLNLAEGEHMEDVEIDRPSGGMRSCGSFRPTLMGRAM